MSAINTQGLRSKKFRTPKTEPFSCEESGAEFSLTFWKPTELEKIQAGVRGDALVEMYVTGNDVRGVVDFHVVGTPPMIVTTDLQAYEEACKLGRQDVVYVADSVWRMAAMLEGMQPRFAKEFYTAEQFIDLFVVLSSETWNAIGRFSESIGKQPEKKMKGTALPPSSVPPSISAEDTPGPSSTPLSDSAPLIDVSSPSTSDSEAIL